MLGALIFFARKYYSSIVMRGLSLSLGRCVHGSVPTPGLIPYMSTALRHRHALLRITQSSPNSTLASPSASASQSIDSPTSSRTKPRRSFYRPLIYGAVFVLVGLTTGNIVRLYLAPPLPLPGTPTDTAALERLHATAGELPIVKELRSHPEEWLEINPHDTLADNERISHLTAGSLGGVRGLAVHIVFWNETEKRLMSVVYFGGALTGWPGVTHGGCLATVMLESLGRVASGNASPRDSDLDGLVKMMELQYRAPTLAKAFYVIRAEFDDYVGKRSGRDMAVLKATLETVDKGVICVEATARCKSPMFSSGVSKGTAEAGNIFSACYNAIRNSFGR